MKKNIIKNKLTLVFILPNFSIGGSERVLINIIKKIDSNKFNIYLIVIDEFGNLKNNIPKNVTIINLNIKRTRWAFFKLYKVLKYINPNITISTHNRSNILILLCSVFLINKFRIVLREPSMPSAQFEAKYLQKFYLPLIKFLYPLASIIIAQTDEMKTELVNYFKLNSNQIKVIPNPIDYESIIKMADSETNPFNTSDINIITVGKLHPLKGYDVLVKAFHKVVQKNNLFKLYIIGKKDIDNNYTEKIKILIESLNLTNNVILKGIQTNPYKFFKYADLSVVSSRWEGMPNVILESQLLGTPVVSTLCVPIIKNLIDDGKNGQICEIDNIDQLSNAIINFRYYKQDRLEYKDNFNWNQFILEVINKHEK